MVARNWDSVQFAVDGRVDAVATARPAADVWDAPVGEPPVVVAAVG
jgi:hypothetical protein